MGMVRLIASKKVFFFNQDNFSNSQIFLERIQQGDSLIICAKEMNDGSYWVEWVYHKVHGRLEPDRTTSFNRSLGKQYLISLVLMALIPAVYYCFTEAGDSFLMMTLVIILGGTGLVGIVLFYLALVKTKLTLTPKQKLIILKALDSVISGKYKLFEESSYIEIDGVKNPKSKFIKSHKAADINFNKTSLLVTRGKVNITEDYNLITVENYTFQTLNKITLQVNKKHMEVLISAHEPSFFNNHKLFISQGDELDILHKKILVKSKKQVVFGIFNHQDGLAYSLIGKGIPQEKWIYSGLSSFIFCILFFFILIACGMSISQTIEKGGYWDYWDWMNIVDSSVMFIISSSTFLLGISYPLALYAAIYFKVSNRGNAYYQSQYLLKQIRRQNGKTDYVTEVF
ncbi:TPA: hypothetical protein I7721_21785 [Vibrio vulnificus]|nr:hypothetical protein [Vibrio vulnificus]